MRKQLTQLRGAMQQEKMDVYLITMEDDHQSEYVSAHFKEIAQISGFTGSAGTLVVTNDHAGLWTDGRYFVQAEAQLKDSGVALMKMGMEGTPSIEDYIFENMPQNGKLGFNGKCVSYTGVRSILKKLKSKNISVIYQKDLPDLFWENRPAKPCEPCFILEEKYSGRSLQDKVCAVREKMAQADADSHIITTLDDIGWILNLRGNDVRCNPVFSSFLIIKKDAITLYTDKGHLTEKVSGYLAQNKVLVKSEEEFYLDVSALTNQAVLIEEAKAGYSVIKTIPESSEIINQITPSSLMKCYKNEVEMENLKKAHIKDGVAVTKFMYWLKHNIGKTPINEWDAALKIEELRKEQEGFIEDSFTTIAAYGPNAAMCHYAPKEDQHLDLQPKGLFLLDSGGHYYEGTTDITRTWSCGPCTEEEKLHYTYCVMSNMRLSDVCFLKGSSGLTLDYAAREIFWKNHLDFNHGTGHGVGYALNVHERPVGIRYKIVPERMDSYPLDEGAFLSNEPGLYIAGSHGIRIENLMMCKNDFKNEYGQFLRFETYTMSPIETEILKTDVMSDRDIELLNRYNSEVYDNLSPYFSGDELEWLKEVCRPVAKS